MKTFLFRCERLIHNNNIVKKHVLVYANNALEAYEKLRAKYKELAIYDIIQIKINDEIL